MKRVENLVVVWIPKLHDQQHPMDSWYCLLSIYSLLNDYHENLPRHVQRLEKALIPCCIFPMSMYITICDLNYSYLGFHVMGIDKIVQTGKVNL